MHGKRRRIGGLAGVAGSAAVVALLADGLLGPAAGGGRVWPGVAPLLGLLLALGGRRLRVALVAGGGAVGLVLAAIAARVAAPAALLPPLGALGAALLAYRALDGRANRLDPVVRPGDLWSLGRTMALAALVPASLALAAAGWRAGLASYLANLLFLLMVTPAVPLVVRRLRQASRLDDPGTGGPAWLPVLGGTVAALILGTVHPDFSFLLPASVLWATVRLGTAGAAATAALVALGDLAASAHGAAPAGTGLAGVAAQGGLLALCFLAGLPLAQFVDGRARGARQARALADRLCLVVQTVGDVLFLVDGEGRWIYLNPAWEALSGLRPDRSLGQSWLERVHPDDRDVLERQAAAVLAGNGAAFRHTLRFQAPGGLRWVELFLHPVANGMGRPAGGAGSLRDVDERKRLEDHSLIARRAAEQRAREATLLASTDELTGIANRRAFLHQLDREIEAAIDYGWPLAVALFDVDHFKAVNDRFGHAVGDRVLQHIAARAVASVRGGDLVGRLGGEEFGILMPGSSAAEAAIVAERLRRAVQMPAVDGQALPAVTVSIGIAQREDQEAAEPLIATADRALYRAKDEGRNRIRIAA